MANLFPELQNLRIRPIASAGTADLRLTITINGGEYQSFSLGSFAELEDDSGVQGLLFTKRDEDDDATGS